MHKHVTIYIYILHMRSLEPLEMQKDSLFSNWPVGHVPTWGTTAQEDGRSPSLCPCSCFEATPLLPVGSVTFHCVDGLRVPKAYAERTRGRWSLSGCPDQALLFVSDSGTAQGCFRDSLVNEGHQLPPSAHPEPQGLVAGTPTLPQPGPSNEHPGS